MQGITVRLMILLLVDGILIIELRSLLRDMVRGKRSRKAEASIYRNQPFSQKVTLSYIRNLLTSYQLASYEKAYSCFHLSYMLEIIAFFPQYILLILFYSTFEKAACIACTAILGIKLLLSLIIRCFLPDGHNSIFKK